LNGGTPTRVLIAAGGPGGEPRPTGGSRFSAPRPSRATSRGPGAAHAALSGPACGRNIVPT